MFTVIIAVIAGCGIMLVTSRDLGPVWGVVCGIATVMVVQLLIGLLVRGKVNAVNRKMQQVMADAQAKLNRKVQMFQNRPGGNVKMLQQMLEKEQFVAMREALEISHEADKYAKWSPMLKKQFNTVRMMLHFQMKEFDQVDALMPKCMFLDVRSIATKLARMYQKKDGGIDKFYRKKCSRFKGEDLALLASTYAWILVKQDRADDALKVLVDAKKKTDNPVVLENWERLANGKSRNFSNAGLGDSWYSLYLEAPKIRQERVRQQTRPF